MKKNSCTLGEANIIYYYMWAKVRLSYGDNFSRRRSKECVSQHLNYVQFLNKHALLNFPSRAAP